MRQVIFCRFLNAFSFSEYCGITGVDTKSYSTKARAFRKTALEKYMRDGGFPELLTETNRVGYVSGLVDAIINTDIAKRFKIRHKDVLRRLATGEHRLYYLIPYINTG